MFGLWFIYDEQSGWPQEGIVAARAWQDVPENWTCPDYGGAKADFDMLEI